MVATALDESHRHAWLSEHPLWELDGEKIHRVFVFSDFSAAFAWMTRVAEIADRMNHHPEWFNVYSRVEVWLTTHDLGGLSDLDLTLAEAMDALAIRA